VFSGGFAGYMFEEEVGVEVAQFQEPTQPLPPFPFLHALRKYVVESALS